MVLDDADTTVDLLYVQVMALGCVVCGQKREP